MRGQYLGCLKDICIGKRVVDTRTVEKVCVFGIETVRKGRKERKIGRF